MRAIVLTLLAVALAGCTRERETAYTLGGTFESVDSAGHVGQAAVLAFRPDGCPGVAYVDLSGPGLRYAWRSPEGAWSVETIASGPQNNISLGLAIDREGRPRITFQRQTGAQEADLRFARHEAAGWTIEVIDAGGWLGSWSSIALDAADTPHVAYFVGYPWYDLRYAVRQGGTWLTEVVDSAGEAGYDPSLILDPEGRPIVAYGNVSHSSILVASRDDSGWHVETAVDHDRFGGSHLQLARRPDGLLCLAYRGGSDLSATDLEYAMRLPGGWQTGTVDAEGDVGYNPSLVLDAHGRPWIGYEGGRGCLAIAFRDGSSWRTVDLDESGAPIYHASLAFAPDGRLGAVVYRDDIGCLYFGWIDQVIASGKGGTAPF